MGFKSKILNEVKHFNNFLEMERKRAIEYLGKIATVTLNDINDINFNNFGFDKEEVIEFKNFLRKIANGEDIDYKEIYMVYHSKYEKFYVFTEKFNEELDNMYDIFFRYKCIG